MLACTCAHTTCRPPLAFPQIREYSILIKSRGPAVFDALLVRLRRLFGIMQVVPPQGYSKAVVLFLTQVEAMRAQGHPAYDVLRNEPFLNDEEPGEALLSILSTTSVSQNAKTKTETLVAMWSEIGSRKDEASDVRRILVQSKATAAEAKHPDMASENRLDNPIRGRLREYLKRQAKTMSHPTHPKWQSYQLGRGVTSNSVHNKTAVLVDRTDSPVFFPANFTCDVDQYSTILSNTWHDNVKYNELHLAYRDLYKDP
jgi:hypothetical protein